MFSWHETTWRNLCRAAFVLLVVLPTCAVAAAVIWCRTPLSLHYHRHVLAERLALDVRIGRVSFSAPGVTIYEDFTLHDPEASRPLFHCDALEWQTGGQTLSITCWRAELFETRRLDLVAEAVNRQLRSLTGSQNTVQLDAPQLTLHPADGLAPQTLADVHGQLQTAADEPQAVLEFRLAGDDVAEPARISMTRNSAEQAGGGTVSLETGPRPLPARLVALCCPGWEAWSPASSFCGRLSWQPQASAWTGEVNGRISGVDLDALVTRRVGHRLSGEAAQVHLEHARVDAGRLTDAAGTITAGPGLVARSLLAAVASQLRRHGQQSFGAQRRSGAYDRLAIRFAIDSEGLVIQGLLDDSPGALLVGDAGDALLGEPPLGPQPLLGLVRILARSDEVVPADPTAQLLLGVLPLKAVTPQTSIGPSAHRLHSIRSATKAAAIPPRKPALPAANFQPAAAKHPIAHRRWAS